MSLKTQRRAATELTYLVARKLDVTDPMQVECPRERSPMTPCVARHGSSACADSGVCVGCGSLPSKLLQSFREANR